MIISKTPYRIPLTGGGTDLDFYFKKKGGELFSVAINQYVYVHLQERKIESNYLIQATDSEFANNIKYYQITIYCSIFEIYNPVTLLYFCTL